MSRVPSVVYHPEFVADHDRILQQLVDGVAWDQRMRARRTASFGTPYNYSGMTYPEQPFLPPIEEIRRRVTGAVGFEPNNCLVNYYSDGDAKMGFHADSLVGLGPGTGVAIVSLGAERTLWFRELADPDLRLPHPLAGGSLLYMPPEIQLQWKHGVAKEPGAGPRISLTFRRVTPPTGE